MAECHLHLQGLELIRHSGLGFLAHLLPSPLLDTVKFLVDIHRCGWQILICVIFEGLESAKRNCRIRVLSSELVLSTGTKPPI